MGLLFGRAIGARVRSAIVDKDWAAGARLLPQNVEAEESVLGAMLLSPDAVGTAIERLSADHFYQPANAMVFEAIEQLYLRSVPIDCLTVADRLETVGSLSAIGGSDRLLMLVAGTSTLSHVDRHARIVEDTALLRRLISVSTQIADLAYSRPEDTAAAIDRAESMVFEVADRRMANTTVAIREMLNGTIDRLGVLAEGGAPPGLATGFRELDAILTGIDSSAFVVVGGRPAMGKTALALSIASKVALAGKPVLLFSLEMAREELSGRLLASDARVDATHIKTGKLSPQEWDRISRSVGRLGDAPLWVDDNPNTTVAEVRAKARRVAAAEGKLGLVVVDYLQLMNGRVNAENRQVEIAEISRNLKILAREMGTPVMGLSQLSRGLESRGDKRPMLSDLRESGAIEQDADVVMFVYRDEVYDADTEDKGMAEIIVSKHRNGPTGTARLAYMPQWTLFADMARS